jgi:F-type H+-transporting ATPase subunit b
MINIFSFNTDIVETNILNLAVVVGVVITFGGDALHTTLDLRREILQSTQEEAIRAASIKQQEVLKLREAIRRATTKADEIRIQTDKTVKEIDSTRHQQLQRDLERIRESGRQTIRLERKRITDDLAQRTLTIAFEITESDLISAFHL